MTLKSAKLLTSSVLGFFLLLSFPLGLHAQLPDDPVENPPVLDEAPQEPPYTQAPADLNEFENADKQPAEILTVPQSVDPAPSEKIATPSPTAPAPEPSSSPVYLEESAGNEEAPLVLPKRAVNPRPHTEKIHHPLAAKGLLKIEKDGTYVYKTQELAHDKSASFRFGLLQPPSIQGPVGDFKSMYGESNIPIVFFDYEWQPFTSLGKLGVQVGLGFFTAQGQGHFVNPDANGDVAQEKYTFLAFPLSLGAVYRLEWMKRQWLAPYISGGGTYFVLAETRDDDKSPKILGSPGVYGAGGAMFNITALNRDTAFTMSSEYGISNMWLTTEFRYIKSLNEDLDFTSAVFNVGIAVDY